MFERALSAATEECFMPAKWLTRSASLALFLIFVASGAVAATATDLIPRTAPQGARAVVVGNGLDAPDLTVQFPSAGGAAIPAPIVSRTATVLEISVPAGAVSGAVTVTGSGSPLGSFAFTVAPDIAVQRVATLAVSMQAHDLLKFPNGVAITSTGTIYVADRLHHQIRVFGMDGTLRAAFGTGHPGFVNGPVSAAQFHEPAAVAIDEARQLVYVADSMNHAIRVITFDGAVSTLAGSGSPGDADGTGQLALFHQPLGVAVEPQGNVWVADTGNNKVKMVTPAGVATTVAGNHSGFADGPAAQALFASPSGVAVSATGVVYVADTKNNAVRKLENGIVTTFAGTGHRGFVDGPGAFAEFAAPLAVAVDDLGGVLVADSDNNAVRRIAFGSAGASVTTLAGMGKAGYVDGAPATAQFHTPAGIATAGVILVGDSGNDALRVLYSTLQATALYPARGPLAGGNVIRIFGTGFIPGATTVTFGGTPATNVGFVTSTELLVTVPAGTVGTVDVTVTAAGATSTLPAAYTYLPPPTISGVTPAKGKTAGGDTVDITGTNFGSASDTSVYFGGVAATIVTITSTDITVLTPAGTPGSVDVRVSAPGGDVTRSGAFTYFAPPVITSFAPTQGGFGATVTITGQNFDPDSTGDQVFFGALQANVVSAAPTLLTVTVPTNATTGPITITTAGGSAVSATSFVVAAFSALQITAPTTTLDVGESIQFNAIGVLTTGGGVDVSSKASWSITTGGALSVSSTGVVTAVAGGTADVTATLNGLSATVHVMANAISLPPQPSTVAPPIPQNQILPFADQTAFLYSGPTPIQTGVTPGAIDPGRVAIIRGSVTGRDGAPIGGVRIQVLGHPELGITMTRADGIFDIAANGGGLLTVAYAKPGYFPAQRVVNAPWADYVWADDVVLVPADTAVTLISSGAATPQVARGTVVSDVDGTRQATILFSPGTQASLMMPDGSTRPAGSLSIRATEYTVGTTGPTAMPAALPAGSGYTYCVELTADEVAAASATGVAFTQPVNVYLENFLGLPVGAAVPSGTYDRTRGVWTPSPDGRIIQIVSITNGVANVDTDGDGTPDDGAAIGLTLAERQTLATLYTAGQAIWRVPVSHFSTWDFNFALENPFMLEMSAVFPYRVRQPQRNWTRAAGCGDPSSSASRRRSAKRFRSAARLTRSSIAAPASSAARPHGTSS